METVDAVVIGAGFGGLGAALTLAERGARPVLLEALAYPGGCASTFTRRGHRFEAGATLFAGFDPGQLFAGWIDRHALPVETLPLDPVITLRAPGLELGVPPSRDALVERLCALPGAPSARLRAFWSEQARVADTLWRCFDDPGLLPPFAPGALPTHLRSAPDLVAIGRLLGRPLARVLDRHGLLAFRPLLTLLDGLCQITVQAGVRDAEAPLALAALDFCFRGARHVRGGIGELASALCGAVERLGGTVRLACRAKALRRDGSAWIVETRDGPLRTPLVVANLLPTALSGVLDTPAPRLDALSARVSTSWGAVMLYLELDPESPIGEAPRHLELVQDPEAPFVEGNHLFCSIDGREDGPGRSATVSTHLPMDRLRGRSSAEQAEAVRAVQDRMRTGLARLAPEVDAAIRHVHPGSPRTFARFVRRPEGLVGGIPRRSGLSHYRDLSPAPVLPGLWAVGDSVFPGQSTLATAIGGKKVAEAALSAR